MKRFWLVVGCVGTLMAITILTALAAPREIGVAIDKVVQLVFAIAALIAYARRRNKWMTAAMTSLTVGLSAWIWGQQILGVQLPTSTIAPLGFTLVPVLCLAAVIVKAQQRRADDLLPNYRSRTVVVLDGLIVIGSLFVLTWVSALESLTRAWATEGPGFATVVAHPAAYLVLLVAIVVLSWTHHSVRQWPMLFVALAGIAQSSSGWVFAFYISKGITAIPATADIGFMLCPALFFLGALAPTRNLEPTSGRMRMADLLHLFVPYLPLAITGLFIMWNTATGGRLNPVEIYVGLAVVCLVIVRQLFTMMDNVRLMDQLRVSREQLRHEATHDPLTSVANRSLFRERLERERQLDGLGRPERQGREDRVAPVAPLGPAPHGRHIPEVPPEAAGDLHDVLRRTEARHQLARGVAVGPRGNRVVLPGCLLDQQHGREVARDSQRAGTKPLHQLQQPASAHPHVPAHHREPRRGGRARGVLRAGKIERDRLAHVRSHAADVRNRAGRFEQHQALIGRGAIEPPAADVVGEGPVVVQRVIAAKRELKARFAFLRPVASSRVAAHPREGRLHVADKADHVRLRDAGNGDRSRSRLHRRGVVIVWRIPGRSGSP